MSHFCDQGIMNDLDSKEWGRFKMNHFKCPPMKLIDKNVSGVGWNFVSRHQSHFLKYGVH